MMNKILEGDHYALLEQWSEDESIQMPEEMADYVKQLEYARSFLYADNSLPKTIKKLRIHFPNLSIKQARSRIADAVEWFYIDGDLKKEAYRHLEYEKQIQLAELAFKISKSVSDIEAVSKIRERAGKMKMLHLPDKEEFPEGMFEQKWKIYSLDTSDVGLPEMADRNRLAEMIDSFNISEADKIRLKQDAGAEPRQILDYHVQEESDPEE